MNDDLLFMNRAIELSILASSAVFPNPFVGAVIVHNGEVIGEGYHNKYGGAHAEVNAINAVNNKDLLSESTIYVNLEPCAHFGKTPPCADLIVKHKFKRVVIGCRDPFSLVNGAGIERIKNAGIEVTCDVLLQKCLDINKRFFTFHEKKRPYIILKWAESKNGCVAPMNQITGQRTKITGSLSHLMVHEQRAGEHAILVGRKTIEMDNPSLTVREIDAPSPIRFVIDPHHQLTSEYCIFKDGQATHILNQFTDKIEGKVQWHKMASLHPAKICSKLHEHGIMSVYIEGGATTLQNFINANLWDEAFQFIGPQEIENGIKAPKIKGKLKFIKSIENDQMYHYENHI
jgi:diaminohydroxyphosphoribosylaminopyrimidine deaminase/5-amino-6-(5-phosphoribosylamino)uracil reductase